MTMHIILFFFFAKENVPINVDKLLFHQYLLIVQFLNDELPLFSVFKLFIKYGTKISDVSENLLQDTEHITFFTQTILT